MTDYFIADFYCAEKRLIVAIGGEIHKNQKEKDQQRDKILPT